MSDITCLCCGTQYDRLNDCPNVEDGGHTLARAQAVARYLLDRGCEHPRPLDVKTATAALDAISRGKGHS